MTSNLLYNTFVALFLSTISVSIRIFIININCSCVDMSDLYQHNAGSQNVLANFTENIV